MSARARQFDRNSTAASVTRQAHAPLQLHDRKGRLSEPLGLLRVPKEHLHQRQQCQRRDHRVAAPKRAHLVTSGHLPRHSRRSRPPRRRRRENRRQRVSSRPRATPETTLPARARARAHAAPLQLRGRRARRQLPHVLRRDAGARCARSRGVYSRLHDEGHCRWESAVVFGSLRAWFCVVLRVLRDRLELGAVGWRVIVSAACGPGVPFDAIGHIIAAAAEKAGFGASRRARCARWQCAD